MRDLIFRHPKRRVEPVGLPGHISVQRHIVLANQKVLIRVRAIDDNLEIAVEDRGRGISSEQMPRLFDAFYTTREDGNGLGLAIVQRIVTDHQGRVDAHNRPGGGARFVLTLPLQRQETPPWWSRLKKRSPV